MKRRDFLKLSGAAAAQTMLGGPLSGLGPARAGGPCSGFTGDQAVAHILPTVSHERMLIKASFVHPLSSAPVLTVGGAPQAAEQTDIEGRFWMFDAGGLDPGTEFSLSLTVDDCPVVEPWTLSTFPDPTSMPSSFRLLAFTCAGGHDLFGVYVPLQLRQRLLRRALSFAPDAVLAIGDHVYWDLRSLPGSLFLGNSSTARDLAGTFDREAAVLGGANEAVLTGAVDYQIAQLYGTHFRGVPVFFVRDDHDYFEDDRVDPGLTTFPPDSFMVDLARSTQRLYYPEFLPDSTRPLALPQSNASDRPSGVSEVFGTLRFGKLVEALLYDCKGLMTTGGSAGLLVPGAAETWILDRFSASDATHVVNVPSNPMGYSAGKYAEWYPDVVEDGMLTTAVAKDGWQEGWLDQHDRILGAVFDRGGVPLVVSGDIHSIAEQKILTSGALDFASNPVVSLVAATPGTRIGWPSATRGTKALPPTSMTVDEVVEVQEVNGFHLLDFTPGNVTIQHFRWDLAVDAPAAIDSLTPFHTSSYDLT